jgi:hypothetical protein
MNAYRILVGKPERKRPLGKPRRRWVANIKIDLRDIGWAGSIWLRIVTQRRALVNTAIKLLVPKNSAKCFRSCTIGGFSRKAQLRQYGIHSSTKPQFTCLENGNICNS